MNFELSGKCALVTGGTAGLGLAVARGLTEEGCSVAIVGRREPPAGLGCRHFKVDLADRPVVEQLIGRVWQEMGPLDILVNNAGTWPAECVVRMTTSQWLRTMDVNLTAPMILSRDFARNCIEQGREGVILNMVSQAAFGGSTSGHADYAASKAALMNLTRTMARELGREGIRVNALAPGMVETEMTAAALADRGDKYLERIPLGRIGKPAEVADVAVFLCSRRAQYMTGATVDVSGGMSMH